MIVTVTPNPSIDRTMALATFQRGEVQRARSARVEPSGKGVNVAVALRLAGCPVRAVLPVAGASGRFLIAMLEDLDLPYVTVATSGSARVNTTLIEDDGTTSKINETGPPMTVDEATAVVRAVEDAGGPGDWVAWCGSLPSGFPSSMLGDAVAAGRLAGNRVALDTSGAALADVLRRPADQLPHLIKPNSDELADLVGHRLASISDVVDAARGIAARGVETVLVSLGRDGAILVDHDVVIHGEAPVDRVVNTAGAGDALLAGYLAGADGSPAERLTSALQFGAAAVQEAGTLLTRSPERLPRPAGPGLTAEFGPAARPDRPAPTRRGMGGSAGTGGQHAVRCLGRVSRVSGGATDTHETRPSRPVGSHHSPGTTAGRRS